MLKDRYCRENVNWNAMCRETKKTLKYRSIKKRIRLKTKLRQRNCESKGAVTLCNLYCKLHFNGRIRREEIAR